MIEPWEAHLKQMDDYKRKNEVMNFNRFNNMNPHS
jgi:hypothetical protein